MEGEGRGGNKDWAVKEVREDPNPECGAEWPEGRCA